MLDQLSYVHTMAGYLENILMKTLQFMTETMVPVKYTNLGGIWILKCFQMYISQSCKAKGYRILQVHVIIIPTLHSFHFPLSSYPMYTLILICCLKCSASLNMKRSIIHLVAGYELADKCVATYVINFNTETNVGTYTYSSNYRLVFHIGIVIAHFIF